MVEQRPFTVAKAPCKSCPYRRDVPSGVWHKSEYAKLLDFDGTIMEQMYSGGRARFDCHQRDGNLCAGWLATHGPNNLLALRLASDRVPQEIWEYTTDVPVFKSGAEAARHGMRDIRKPGEDAKRMMGTLEKKRDRDGWVKE